MKGELQLQQMVDYVNYNNYRSLADQFISFFPAFFYFRQLVLINQNNNAFHFNQQILFYLAQSTGTQQSQLNISFLYLASGSPSDTEYPLNMKRILKPQYGKQKLPFHRTRDVEEQLMNISDDQEGNKRPEYSEDSIFDYASSSDDDSLPLDFEQSEMEMIHRVFAKSIIENDEYDRRLVMKRLKKIGISHRKLKYEGYTQLRFRFVNRVVKYIQKLMTSFADPNLKPLFRHKIKTLVPFVFNCKQKFTANHLNTLLGIVKIHILDELVQITKQELISLHQRLSECGVIKSDPVNIDYREEGKKRGRTNKYFSNIEQINKVWRDKHEEYLKQLYKVYSTPKQKLQMFRKKFPQDFQVWNQLGIQLQWYKVTRLAYNYLKAMLRQDRFKQNKKCPQMPVVSRQWVDRICKQSKLIPLQLKMIQIQDKKIKDRRTIYQTVEEIKQMYKEFKLEQNKEDQDDERRPRKPIRFVLERRRDGAVIRELEQYDQEAERIRMERKQLEIRASAIDSFWAKLET